MMSARNHGRRAPSMTSDSNLGPDLRTPRLHLRRWRVGDRAPFAELNADAEVMRHFPGILSREQSDASADRIEEHFAIHGFGLWAVEVQGVVGIRRLRRALGSSI